MPHDNPALQASLGRIRSNIDRFATAFYLALYQRAPGLRRLFGSPEQERRKLGAMLATLGNLQHWDKLEPALHKLGERHVQYGVETRDYPSLLDAFLDGVREIEGEYAAQSCPAWQTLFSMVIATMTSRLTGAARSPAAAVAAAEAASPLLQAAREARLLDAADARPLLRDIQPPAAGTLPRATAPEDGAATAVLATATPHLPAGCETLFAEVGGMAAITRVHERFYTELFADDWLGGFFATKNQASLVHKQTRFMAAAFGGPDEYRWDSPALAHMHMQVSDEQADIREIYLRNAIRAEGFSASIEERWLATDQAFRPAIVKDSVADCVLRHPGQMAVSVRKPVGYKPPRLQARAVEVPV